MQVLGDHSFDIINTVSPTGDGWLSGNLFAVDSLWFLLLKVQNRKQD